MASAYDFEAESITGETVALDKYRESVTLVVNVASK